MAPADRFWGAPEGHRPWDLLPSAQSVLVFAFPFLESTFLTPNPRVYVMRYDQLRMYSQDVGYASCRYLEERGYMAINLPGTAPMDVFEKNLLFADFSYRHAAVEAGLGEIGWNQLLCTTEFGPRVWLMAVITNAKLDPDPRLEKKVCLRDECNLCIQSCPQKALTPGQSTDKKKCTSKPDQFGLGDTLRHIRNVFMANDPEARNELIFSPITKAIWMHLQYGGPPARCNYCIAVCPIGRKF